MSPLPSRPRVTLPQTPYQPRIENLTMPFWRRLLSRHLGVCVRYGEFHHVHIQGVMNAAREVSGLSDQEIVNSFKETMVKERKKGSKRKSERIPKLEAQASQDLANSFPVQMEDTNSVTREDMRIIWDNIRTERDYKGNHRSRDWLVENLPFLDSLCRETGLSRYQVSETWVQRISKDAFYTHNGVRDGRYAYTIFALLISGQFEESIKFSRTEKTPEERLRELRGEFGEGILLCALPGDHTDEIKTTFKDYSIGNSVDGVKRLEILSIEALPKLIRKYDKLSLAGEWDQATEVLECLRKPESP